MKKYLLLTSLLLSVSMFSSRLKESNFNKTVFSYVQQSSYEAYAFHNGSWHTGRIYIRQNQNGYQLISYSFNDLYMFNSQPLAGDFLQGQRLTPLNPNNELAKRNNFTHYVNIQGINVYIIAN
ncbi:hypothetical protein ACHRV6_23370 [Flavobacterium sp. FlaQc-51]|uniref:hypothetical protein n=1 Tax=Flavobacterium sp. FlaQc-51 TaxID=3374184 RepID=UPI003756CA12